MCDTREHPDMAQGIVGFQLEQFLEHGTMGKVDKERMSANAVLAGESAYFFVEFSW